MRRLTEPFDTPISNGNPSPHATFPEPKEPRISGNSDDCFRLQSATDIWHLRGPFHTPIATDIQPPMRPFHVPITTAGSDFVTPEWPKAACLKTASIMAKTPFRSLIIAAYYGDVVPKDAHYPTWHRRSFGGVTFGDQNTVHNRRKKMPFSKVPFFA